MYTYEYVDSTATPKPYYYWIKSFDAKQVNELGGGMSTTTPTKNFVEQYAHTNGSSLLSDSPYYDYGFGLSQVYWYSSDKLEESIAYRLLKKSNTKYWQIGDTTDIWQGILDDDENTLMVMNTNF